MADLLDMEPIRITKVWCEDCHQHVTVVNDGEKQCNKDNSDPYRDDPEKELDFD